MSVLFSKDGTMFLGGPAITRQGLAMFQATVVCDGPMVGFIKEYDGPRPMNDGELFDLIAQVSKEVWHARTD